MAMGGQRKCHRSVTMASALACTLFPAGTLSRQECEHRDHQGIQHPEVRPHVEAPPVRRSCAEARVGMRWSEMPCRPEGARNEKGKKIAPSGGPRRHGQPS